MIKNRKSEAIRLRTLGKSYNEIQKIVPCSKSTLSLWLRNIPNAENIKTTNQSNAKKIWAQNITKYNKKRAAQARLNSSNLEKGAKGEIHNISPRELKIIGTSLYWAEGYKRTKWNAVFSNSDPDMIKLMMRFFREICSVPEERFRLQVQTHPNVDTERANKFWSEICGIEPNKFRKPLIQVSSASKRKRPPMRLPYGTLRIGIAHAPSFCKIKGWIQGLIAQT
ncbi:hypothetical protein KBD59_00045 [Candidatus Gracilibacteria bacterium]|nr:hypothetical protein [Candidatus Gracilibacteria bacterium]